ncbi:MAG: IS110 family transposase [Erysipelotrichia bacterium]|nr:IS110 family transposase [Erysipelotrichia bacterium]
MKKLFIGIDISKDNLDVCCIEASSEKKLLEFKVKNTESGIVSILKKVSRLKFSESNTWYCFEHTGTYGYLLAYLFNEKEVCYSCVPGLEIKRSIGITRGSNDKVDAQRIALYACRHRKKLEPSKFPSETILKIKNCLACRKQLMKISTQLKNSIHSHKLVNKIVDNQIVIDELTNQLKAVTASLRKIEKEIIKLVKQDESVYKNYKLINSVVGIGPIIGAHMIVYTANFQSFSEARKFNCYAGIAPFSNNSGTSIHTKPKVNNMANKQIKKLLSNGANSAVRHDPELRKYYLRKINEGKQHNSIINAVCCKLVARMFAVIARQTEFVHIYSYSLNA